MRRFSLVFSSLVAGLFTGPVLAASTPAPALTTTPGAYVAAPNPTVRIDAPKEQQHCGLFQTCANTKIGLGKGDFIIRLSAIGVITNNTHSSVRVYAPGAHKKDGGTPFTGGNLTVTNQAAPEFTFEYFLNDHFSIDAIAASTHHAATLHNVQVLHDAFGASPRQKVGSFWILPPTVTLAYHFLPHRRFNPYIGVGITVAFFHNTSTNNTLLNDPHLRVTPGPSFNLGFDYQLAGNWFLNADVKQILLKVPVRVNGAHNGPLNGFQVRVHDRVNPTVVGAGIGYRF